MQQDNCVQMEVSIMQNVWNVMSGPKEPIWITMAQILKCRITTYM